MGKRQIRFTGETLASADLIRKEVNVVFIDSSVRHLRVLELFSDHLLAEDMSKKKHKILFKEVYEIILDLVSAY